MGYRVLISEDMPDIAANSLSVAFGDFKRKRFRVDIRGSVMSAEALMEMLRRRFAELTPWTIDTHAEPGALRCLLEDLAAELRGHHAVVRLGVEHQ